MRRLALAGAALAAVATLGMTGGLSGVASAATLNHKPALHIKPGTIWTILVEETGLSEPCEFQQFGTGNIWVADLYGDAGTYTGGGKTVSETWTSGDSVGLTFSGTWNRKTKHYVGFFTGGSLDGVGGLLVKGEILSWDGVAC